MVKNIEYFMDIHLLLYIEVYVVQTNEVQYIFFSGCVQILKQKSFTSLV